MNDNNDDGPAAPGTGPVKLIGLPQAIGKPAPGAEALRQLEQDMPFAVERVKHIAHLHRVKYTALVAEGFNEAQALELCRMV